MAGTFLTDDEKRLVADAIRKAEARTSGEVYCVLAGASDDYFFPAALMLLAGVLVASLPAALLLEHWWIDLRMIWFVASQVAALAAALVLVWRLPPLRHLLVPRGLQYRRAHDNALKQFLAHNVHATARRTGVLIFVSLTERYAEIVADAGIDEKVDQDRWDAMVARLADAARRGRLAEGFVGAVEEAGLLLAREFPPNGADVNELDDHLVEI